MRIYPQKKVFDVEELPSLEGIDETTRVAGFQERQDKRKRKHLIRMVLEGDEPRQKTQKKKDDA